MQRELGMLTAKVDMILEGVRRSEEKADINRASMHRRMDEIVDRVSKVETTTATVKEDIDEIKPTVDDVKLWRQRGIGALAIDSQVRQCLKQPAYPVHHLIPHHSYKHQGEDEGVGSVAGEHVRRPLIDTQRHIYSGRDYRTYSA